MVQVRALSHLEYMQPYGCMSSAFVKNRETWAAAYVCHVERVRLSVAKGGRVDERAPILRVVAKGWRHSEVTLLQSLVCPLQTSRLLVESAFQSPGKKDGPIRCENLR